MLPTQEDLRAVLVEPAVAEAIQTARDACTQIRWHPAMRKRSAEVRAECTIRAAAASAVLDGARVDYPTMRSFFLGEDLLRQEATDQTVRGAARATFHSDELAKKWAAASPVAVPGELARLHKVAAAGLVPEADLGRPRVEVAAAVAPVAALISAPPPDVPVLAVAAIVYGEIASQEFFLGANGVTARAVARAIQIGRGLDPMGACVWEQAMATGSAGSDLGTMLQAYASGSAAGLQQWLLFWAAAVTAGVAEGERVAMSVLAGSLEPGA